MIAGGVDQVHADQLQVHTRIAVTGMELDPAAPGNARRGGIAEVGSRDRVVAAVHQLDAPDGAPASIAASRHRPRTWGTRPGNARPGRTKKGVDWRVRHRDADVGKRMGARVSCTETTVATRVLDDRGICTCGRQDDRRIDTEDAPRFAVDRVPHAVLVRGSSAARKSNNQTRSSLPDPHKGLGAQHRVRAPAVFQVVQHEACQVGGAHPVGQRELVEPPQTTVWVPREAEVVAAITHEAVAVVALSSSVKALRLILIVTVTRAATWNSHCGSGCQLAKPEILPYSVLSARRRAREMTIFCADIVDPISTSPTVRSFVRTMAVRFRSVWGWRRT